MSLQPKHRMIQLGDSEKKITITFTMEELKYLEGMVLDVIERERIEENTEVLPHKLLAQKLEYFVSDNLNELEE